MLPEQQQYICLHKDSSADIMNRIIFKLQMQDDCPRLIALD